MIIFYSGFDNGRHEYGVGFISKESLIKLVKKLPISEEGVALLGSVWQTSSMMT